MPKRYRSNSGLVSWLNDCSLAVFALDARGRFRFFNQGAVSLTGCSQEEILGKSCEYRSMPTGSLSERVLVALSPPPEVFQGEQRHLTAHFIDAHGETRHVQLLFLPLLNPEQELLTVLACQIDQQQPAPVLPAPLAQQLHVQLSQLLHQQHQALRYEQLITASPAMQRVSTQVSLARQSPVPVCLQGLPGTGKSLIARTIARRKESDFVPLGMIDCARLEEGEQKRLLQDLLEFARDSDGESSILCKSADRLPQTIQHLILEWHHQGQWPADCRLITSTTRSIFELKQQNLFSVDFYYHATSQLIQIPSLQERCEDFDLLVQAFVESCNRDRQQQLTGIDPHTRLLLQEYSWPGQIQELRAIIEEACELCEGSIITPNDLSFRFHSGQTADALMPIIQETFQPLQQTLEEVERREIERALKNAKSNKAKAASLLGMTRAKFYRRLEALGIEQD